MWTTLHENKSIPPFQQPLGLDPGMPATMDSTSSPGTYKQGPYANQNTGKLRTIGSNTMIALGVPKNISIQKIRYVQVRLTKPQGVGSSKSVCCTEGVVILRIVVSNPTCQQQIRCPCARRGT